MTLRSRLLKYVKKPEGFTLIELLIVLGIVAAISAVVVVTLNPVELLKQGRDSTRISDLNTLNNALNLYGTENSGGYGSASTTYISIPDTDPGCAHLGLPTSTGGFSYHCVTTSTLKNTDGTGWLPLDFRKITAGSPMTSLSVDPTNTTSGGFYYTYNTPGTSWQLELTAALESQKYQPTMKLDGGASDLLYEVGSNLNLIPPEVLNRASSTYAVGADNPAPALSSIYPTSTPVGGSGLTLTVNGSNFINSSVVNFNGVGRTTTFASSGQITASILSADVAASGTYPITVTNPLPGGGTSGSANLAVQTFAPSGSWVTDSTSSPSQSYGNTLTEVNGNLYILAGNSTTFKKYSTATKVWSTLASTTAAVKDGAALVKYNSDTIYAFQGNGTAAFWKYTISSNSWTAMTSAPGNVSYGGALVYPGAGDFIYAFQGSGSGVFWQYSVSNNSWGMNGATQGYGNSIAEVSGKFYILNGGGNAFYKFDPATYNWTTLATTSAAVGSGGALVKIDNDTIFALRGANTTDFWKYTISSNTWVSLASTPGAVERGGALAYPGGDFVYAFRGNADWQFWRYSIANNNWGINGTAQGFGNSVVEVNAKLYVLNGGGTVFQKYDPATYNWTTLATTSAAVGSGGALVKIDNDTIFALRGANTTDFWKYTISSNTWTSKAPTPGAVERGGALAYPGGDFIYAFRGVATSEFWKYSMANDSWGISGTAQGVGNSIAEVGGKLYVLNGNGNVFQKFDPSTYTWTTLTTTPNAVGSGGALVKTDSDTIYAFRGAGTTSFWKYGIMANAWTVMASSTSAVNYGGALAYPGTGDTIYAFAGNSNTFLKYSIGGDSWSSGTVAPATVSYGGALTAFNSNTLYGLQGNSATTFWLYNIASGTWTAKAVVPTYINAGASLTSDGSTIYATTGNGAGTFYKYTPGNNTWTALAGSPVIFGDNGSDAKGGIAYSSTFGSVYGVTGNGTTVGQSIVEYHPSTGGWPIPEWSPAQVNYGGSLVAFDSNTIYGIPGVNTNVFSLYNIASGTWTAKAVVPTYINAGASLTSDGSTIYATTGNGAGTFYKYTPGNNTWTALAGSPVIFGDNGSDAKGGIAYSSAFGSVFGVTGNGTTIGQSLVQYNPATNGWPIPEWSPAQVNYGGSLVAFDSNTIYGTPGVNTNVFSLYNIASGTWTGKTGTPSYMNGGGSLTTDGTYIYATTGNGTKNFYKYNPGNNTWATLASSPVAFGDNGSDARGGIAYSAGLGSIYGVTGLGISTGYEIMKYDPIANGWPMAEVTPTGVSYGASLTALNSTTLYGFQGNNANPFWSYDIPTGVWSTKANTLAYVNAGGALTNDGATIYATTGNGTANFYSYKPNTWTVQASLPSGMADNGVDARGGIIYSQTAGAIYAVPGTNTSVYKLLITGQ